MKTITNPLPSIPAVRRQWVYLALAACAGFSTLLRAQAPPNPQYPPVAPDAQIANLSPAALDDLLGPIALYPDALIALILPASTIPSEITLAARYLANNGDSNQLDAQPWDNSVKSLARYPDVVAWMDENLEWTTGVGDAFIAQPADVMNSIQRLREQARAAGNLVDTPQQKVVQEVVRETTYIRIVPAEPEVIYVPVYDPEVVYYERQPDFFAPVISFGVGFALGSWLNYDCDWGRHDVYYGDYRPGWNRNWNDWNGGRGNYGGNETNINVVNINNNSAQVWQPSAGSRRQLTQRRPNYNRRVQAANAEVKDLQRLDRADAKAERKANRLHNLPQPTRLSTVSHKEERQVNRKSPRNTAGKAPEVSDKVPTRPSKAPDVAKTSEKKKSKPVSAPPQTKQAPTTAPQPRNAEMTAPEVQHSKPQQAPRPKVKAPNQEQKSPKYTAPQYKPRENKPQQDKQQKNSQIQQSKPKENKPKAAPRPPDGERKKSDKKDKDPS